MTECIDASVIVKWFKKDEPYNKEANRIFKRLKDFEADFVGNEWLLLEVTRGLVKAKIKEETVKEAYNILGDLFSLGAIKRIPVTPTLDLAKSIEIELNLYAADSVHLATAIITNSEILWSEDEHLNKKKVKDYASRYGLEIKKLA